MRMLWRYLFLLREREKNLQLICVSEKSINTWLCIMPVALNIWSEHCFWKVNIAFEKWTWTFDLKGKTFCMRRRAWGQPYSSPPSRLYTTILFSQFLAPPIILNSQPCSEVNLRNSHQPKVTVINFMPVSRNLKLGLFTKIYHTGFQY